MVYLRYFTFTFLMGWTSAASAEGASDDYIQSQKCSGALSIMTSIGLSDDTTPLYKYFYDLSMFHSYLFEHYARQTEDTLTNGEVARLVSEGILIVDSEMTKDSNSLQLNVKKCVSWLAAVQLHGQAYDPAATALEVMASMPAASGRYEYPFSDWSPMIPVTEFAYELWVGSNLREYHHCIATGKKPTVECMLLTTQ
jgi:hypothetical protein